MCFKITFLIFHRATELGEEAHRLRAPRCIHSDHHLRPYNSIEAEGNRLLKELEKGKYATTDAYLYHYPVTDKKEILLLTNKRIAYVVHNDLFGGWQVEWSYTWQEVDTVKFQPPKGIHIYITEKKRKALFGSSDAGKIVLINDIRVVDFIIQTIEQLKKKQ